MKREGLKIKRVNKAINGLKIVDNVTASFLTGRITALIGPNGAGKTTLFHLISGELKADGGDIFYMGDNITALPPYKVAQRGIGRLFQDVRIFENLTVLENVASSCYSYKAETPWFPFIKLKNIGDVKKDAAKKALFWLDFVGLSDMENAPASALSYGQQKLLSIARLLAGGFTVFLLDEPTAGLNPLMIRKVLALLEKIVAEEKDKTIVLVEHDMGVVRDIADWVYFMNEGRISFFGRTDHVLGDKEVREIYLGL